ncbi:hypothetical protein [Caldalkalibacillus salinus]|uniref:hypothetical protein n=1 Tax=Caldalkalibacillus salinus TaxID=2803787 RepID=UPI001922E620|nr:hypothetical protein [Caldalkalibacillus salinus]
MNLSIFEDIAQMGFYITFGALGSLVAWFIYTRIVYFSLSQTRTCDKCLYNYRYGKNEVKTVCPHCGEKWIIVNKRPKVIAENHEVKKG